MIIFETERLYVRQFTNADFESLYKINSDAEVMKYIRVPMTHEGVKELLDNILQSYEVHPRLGRFAVMEKNSEDYIGNFVLRPSDLVSGMELGYAFFKNYWGVGYATELTLAGLQFAFKKQKLRKVFAITDVQNGASQRVLLKSGFIRMPDIFDKDRQLCLFRATILPG